MVAEVHRILMRGGVFMYPQDTKDPSKPGRLRLLYEANPIGFAGRAGGRRAPPPAASAMLDIVPEALHQRVPVIFGSRNEVERIERYHEEYDERHRPAVQLAAVQRALAVPARRAESEAEHKPCPSSIRSSPSPAHPAPAPRTVMKSFAAHLPARGHQSRR